MSSDYIPSGRPRSQRWLWIIALVAILGFGGLTLYRDSADRRIAAQWDAIRRAGEPTTSKEADAWYEAVPLEENAALKIMEAADWLAPNSTRMGDGDWPRRGERLTVEQEPRITEMLAANAPALKALHAATLSLKSRYFVDLSIGPSTLLPHLAKVKSMAQLLRVEALHASNLGQTELAVRSIHAGLGLARSLEAEPVTVSQLVRVASLSIAGRSLEDTLSLHPLPAASLERLASELAAAEAQNQKGLRRAFVGERCLGRCVFDMPIGQSVQVFEQGAGDASVALHAALKLVGVRDQDYLFYLRTMNEWIQIAGLSYPECLTQARQVGARCESQLREHRLFIYSAALLPSLQGVIEKEAEATALLRCGQVALAIERFRMANAGQLPDRLDQLVPAFIPRIPADPYDGSPLRYKLMQKGFVVFSVGKNGADDGGVEPVLRTGSSKPADVSFTVAR